MLLEQISHRCQDVSRNVTILNQNLEGEMFDVFEFKHLQLLHSPKPCCPQVAVQVRNGNGRMKREEKDKMTQGMREFLKMCQSFDSLLQKPPIAIACVVECYLRFSCISAAIH